MAGREFEPPALRIIYTRLKRAEFRSTGIASNLFPQAQAAEILDDPNPAALVGRVLYLDSGPFTNAARSELAIGESEPALLDARVNQVRDFLSINGKSFKEYSEKEYQEWIDAGLRSPEDCDLSLWYETDLFEVVMDTDRPTADRGDKLWVTRSDDKTYMQIEFSFDDDFKLFIEFKDPEQRGVDVVYSTSVRPLNEMTPEEYEIIAYCLDEFIAKEIPEPHS